MKDSNFQLSQPVEIAKSQILKRGTTKVSENKYRSRSRTHSLSIFRGKDLSYSIFDYFFIKIKSWFNMNLKEKEKLFIEMENKFKHDLSVAYFLQRLFVIERKLDNMNVRLNEDSKLNYKGVLTVHGLI